MKKCTDTLKQAFVPILEFTFIMSELPPPRDAAAAAAAATSLNSLVGAVWQLQLQLIPVSNCLNKTKYDANKYDKRTTMRPVLQNVLLYRQMDGWTDKRMDRQLDG